MEAAMFTACYNIRIRMIHIKQDVCSSSTHIFKFLKNDVTAIPRQRYCVKIKYISIN